jgi:DoxX-like family
MSIYVERVMNMPRGKLWALTQSPELHQRWDLRFSAIRYLPRANAEEAQHFEYETRLGFGLCIRGTGTSVGEHHAEDGTSSSALVFGSSSPFSLIRKGNGYWQYEPLRDGKTRFVTAYEYAVRWGKLGWVVDRAIFRPLMAWATAWSFDRLARWGEEGVSPETSFRVWVGYAIARGTLAGVWFYQGIIPKLMGPHAQEVLMSVWAGVPAAWATAFVLTIGVMEVLFSVIILALWRRRWPPVVSAIVMVPALIVGARALPEVATAPFNIAAFNAMTAALSLVVAALQPDVVTASACVWRTHRRERLAELGRDLRGIRA